MESQNKEVDALVQKITGLHAAISKLPCPDVDALFTDLVTACVPPSPVDVTKLGPEAQKMREGLIRLCSEAEGKLEAHYSDLLAAFDNPLDHLGMFPYYSNYINLSKLEYELLARYMPGGIAPTRVAFIGSGPLPFSSFVLAARHLPDTAFDNYDICGAANDRVVASFSARIRTWPPACRSTRPTSPISPASLPHTTWSSWPRSWAWPPRRRPRSSPTSVHTWRTGRPLSCAARMGRAGSCTRSSIRRTSVEVVEVLAVCHPDDDVVNSVIIARKSNDDVHADVLQNGRGRCARGAAPVVSPPCRFGEMVADVAQKREEFANAEVAF